MQIRKQTQNKKGFTIVELLTVMSVIIILIGLLVPALNQVKRYAKEVKQRAQFHSIDVAMELFETENDGYPPSDDEGSDENPYCGAMKLAEAMVGQDLLGFHQDSAWRSDMRDAGDNMYLYAIPGNAASAADTDPVNHPENKEARRGTYLQLENANATRLTPHDPGGSLPIEPGVYDPTLLTNEYDSGDISKAFVLCDVYTRNMSSGYKTGMPVLYYRANLGGSINPNQVNSYNQDDDGRIYLFEDNDKLVEAKVPWDSANNNGDGHPMYSNYQGLPTGARDGFYWQINNDSISINAGRPFKSDSYILISAGFDGLYGTRDDIYNFQN